MAKNTWKDGQQHLSSRKCKSEPQGSYHFTPAIMVITRRQKITSISEDLGKQNSFVLLVGM